MLKGIALALGVASLGLAAPAFAQQCNCPMNCPMMNGQKAGGAGWSSGPYARMYNPRTVETVKGQVLSIERTAGVHVTLKTDHGNLTVALGPAWYLDNQETQLAVGDRVQVTGSRVTINGTPSLIAAQVTRGEETLHLRDANGVPVWRGWGRAR